VRIENQGDNGNLQGQVVYVNVERSTLNEHISIFVVQTAVFMVKLCQSCGIYTISVDILQNDNCILSMHLFYNICLNTGIITFELGTRHPYLDGVYYHIVELPFRVPFTKSTVAF
jgi:hypothetical protein